MPIWWSDTACKDMYAWEMDKGPYDVIVGSAAFADLKAVIDYDAQHVAVRVGEARVTVPFGISMEERAEAATAMYATETVMIPANHQGVVPINASSSTGVSEGLGAIFLTRGMNCPS